METRYLIDTSAIIKYLNENFPANNLEFIDEIVDKDSNLSVISQIELLCWSPTNSEDFKIFQQFIEESKVIQLTEGIVNETIRVRRAYGVKLPDSIIAATAIINDFVLIADNDKDFIKITELKYINPNKIIDG